MKGASRIWAAIWVVASLGAAAADSDSCDLKSGPIDCDVIKARPMYRYERMNGEGARANSEIDQHRLQFWFTYPDPDTPEQKKPGHEQARENFAQALFEKDIFYLQAAVLKKLGEDFERDPSGRRGWELLTKGFEFLTGQPDGGIRQTARPEFDAWAKATREALGPMRQEDIFKLFFQGSAGPVSEAFRKASDPGGAKAQAYFAERDWAEFDAARRVPALFQRKEWFGFLLYLRRGSLPSSEAANVFSGMKQALTPAVVEAAAEQVRQYAAKMKTGLGNLVVTAPRPVKKGPGGSEVEDPDVPMPDEVLGTYGDPLVAMEVLATKDDDYRYLLYLIKGQYFRDARNLLPVQEKWSFAVAVADRLKLAFGDKDVLAVAHAIRAAKKNMADYRVMRPDLIGSTRVTPFSAFEDVLARRNPRGYLRLALLWKERLEKPADLEAAYKKFVDAHGEPAALEAARRLANGRPNFIHYDELSAIIEAIHRGPEPAAPAEVLVDFPDYLGWKKFAPGTRVSWVQRMWRLDPAGRLAPAPIDYGFGFQLQTIDAAQVKLWFTETSYRNGQKRPSTDREVFHPAKARVAPTPRYLGLAPESNLGGWSKLNSPPVASGDEVIQFQNTRLATRWQSKTYEYVDDPAMKGYLLTVKVWTSDQVPTGLVRRTEDRVSPPGAYGPTAGRFIIETSLETLEGFFPPGPVTTGPATTAYVPPPSPFANRLAGPGAPASAGPAAGPVPRPSPTNPVPPNQAPAPAPPRPDPKVFAATVNALAQRYMADLRRATQARSQMAQRAAAAIPANVRTELDRLDGYMNAAAMTMNAQTPGAAEQNLKLAEDALAIIEKFLEP